MSTIEKLDAAMRFIGLGVQALRTGYEALSALADDDGEATEEKREEWRQQRVEIKRDLDAMIAELDLDE